MYYKHYVLRHYVLQTILHVCRHRHRFIALLFSTSVMFVDVNIIESTN